MSGARSSQNFGVRIALDGQDAVESGLRRVQAAAQQTGQAVSAAGDSTGRALAVIERGTQSASAGLAKLGGDFAALSPLVDSAGSSVLRLVNTLISGGGLVGVLGAAGAAVTALVALYNNWDTASRAVGSAVDFLTGRVRLNETAIRDANGALRAYLQLSETAAQAGNRRFIERQRDLATAAEGRIPGLEAEVTRLESALATARAGGGTGRVIARGGASGLVPTDEFGQQADRAVQDQLARRNEMDALRLEGELRQARAALSGQRRIVAETEGRIAGALQDQGNLNPGSLPAEQPAARAARGGGGGGAASRTNDALRDREQILQRNLTAEERYTQGMERLADLQDRLRAQDPNSVLPDEVVQREATRLMEEYERATRNAGDSTRSLADDTKEWGRAAQGAAKALTGAFEDLIFNGKNADEVLRDLERSLIRIGNQTLLQPLFQRGFGSLFGTGQQGGSGGAGGAIGNLVGSLFGASGGGKGAIDALQAAGTLVAVAHGGWQVGQAGVPTRAVPMDLFAGAPRFHSGTGWIGPDERPVIVQTGERILNRQETAEYQRGGMTVINQIHASDAESFRRSRGQVLTDLSRSVGRGSRNR